MAKVELLVPLIFKWEGGLSDKKCDRGGKTNMGITLTTWQSCGYDKDGDGDIDFTDLKLITKQDVVNMLKKHYWNRCCGDAIINQSVANLLVDWTWNSGVWGIKNIQKILQLKADGIVGKQTIKAINSADQSTLFFKLWTARKAFFANIVKNDPSQAPNLAGWNNRLNSFKYSPNNAN